MTTKTVEVHTFEGNIDEGIAKLVQGWGLVQGDRVEVVGRSGQKLDTSYVVETSKGRILVGAFGWSSVDFTGTDAEGRVEYDRAHRI